MEPNNNINGSHCAEKEALKQFRTFVSGITPNVPDSILLKFLRSNSFNVKKCELVYRESSSSKLLYRTEDLENFQLPKEIQNYVFDSHMCFAKDGSPVRHIAMGKGDLKGSLNSLDIYTICKYCSHVIETDLKLCREQSQKLGKDIHDGYYIVDMEGFSIRNIFFSGVIEIGLDLFRMLQDHYPEIWNRILVVNAPVYFQTIFNIFKPILRVTLLEKIDVASRDRSASLLLKYIDPEVLPAFLGGTRVDSFGNATCDEFMKFGGMIPEVYYLCNTKPQLLPTDPGVTDVWVPPRSCYNYSFVVKEADSVIKVEIRTEGGSIPACVLYREFPTDSENFHLPSTDKYIDDTDTKNPWRRISPSVHIPTHYSPIDNHCYPPWPGIYVYKFDNTYNWWTSRRIIFRIQVLPPGSIPL